MKKIVFIFIFLISCFLLLVSNVSAAQITVCLTGTCDYSGPGGIQEAIEKAKDGDTISIAGGDYNFQQATVVDPDFKYQNCLVHTRGKKLTLQGIGKANINNSNYPNLTCADMTKANVGICVIGGDVTISSITVTQTCRQAIYVQNAKAIIKNVTTVDIDNTSIEVRDSQVMVLNSILTGGGISIGDSSYARIENNVIYGGGIVFNLCNNNEPTGDVSNNILVRSNIAATCPEQTQKIANIKLANNFVYKGSPTGDQACVGPGNTEGEACAAGELCTGSRFEWPGFVGHNTDEVVCVWGEGRIDGDFNTRSNSPATLAKAGISTGPCSNGAAPGCTAYIQNNLLPEPPQPPGPGPGPGPGPNPPGPQEPTEPIPTSHPVDLTQLLGPAAYGSNGFFLFLYVILSAVYIMVMQFAVGIKNFNIFLMVGYFLLGGIIGFWFHSYEMGLVTSIILSLIFI